MKHKFLLCLLLSVLCVGYSLITAYRMVVNYATPFSMSCEGIMLHPDKVYTIGNAKPISNDTIGLSIGDVLFPQKLGSIVYHSGRYFLYLSDSIRLPTDTIHVLYPVCTHKDKAYTGFVVQNDLEQGIDFRQRFLSEKVSLCIYQLNSSYFLNVKSGAIGTIYSIPRKNTTKIGIIFSGTSPEKEVKDGNACVFLGNKNADTGRYTCSITPKNFYSYTYRITNELGQVVCSGDSSDFVLGNHHFRIQTKYSLGFYAILLSILMILVCFQGFLLYNAQAVGSPVVQATAYVRILFNNLTFLATVIFLHAYGFYPSRIWFFAPILCLNLSFVLALIAKRYGFGIKVPTTFLKLFAWLAVIAITILLKLFTKNESLFGIIPALHLVKLALCGLIYVVTNPTGSKRRQYFIQLATVLVYTIAMSKITHDFGSIIFVSSAMLLIGLVQKTIPLKYAISCLIVCTGFACVLYCHSPATFTGKKYRLIAPYINPDNKELAFANEGDKETNSNIYIGYKLFLQNHTPEMEKIVIPRNARSTCFSDYSVYWSIHFGGIVFFILLLANVCFLLSELLLLLYCSIRTFQIREATVFLLPQMPEASLIRFLIAITVISIVYPLCANCFIVPLTGQSIPCFAISIVEPLFIAVLLVMLHFVFTSDKYLLKEASVQYCFADAKRSIQKMSVCFALCFVLAIAVRAYCFSHHTPDFMTWKKQVTVSANKISTTNKDSLMTLAKLIANNKTEDLKSDRSNLANLAALFYTQKTYYSLHRENTQFENSTASWLRRLSIDSILAVKRQTLSGIHKPFGVVTAYYQQVNGKPVFRCSNRYYSCIEPYQETVIPDLTAECNLLLETHLHQIGIAANKGAILIADNFSGQILCNSSCPISELQNSNSVYYFVGSTKKALLTAAALAIDEGYADRKFAGRNMAEAIQYSNDDYPAALLKDLLMYHRTNFETFLDSNFDLSFQTEKKDGYFDVTPRDRDFQTRLDSMNPIYRIAIGQQQPYSLFTLTQWYVRLAAGKKVNLTFDRSSAKVEESLRMSVTSRQAFSRIMFTPFNGTAAVVKTALKKYSISVQDMVCKTGTAQLQMSKRNSSSTFVLSNSRYTISIMLYGDLPENDAAQLAAKDLFVTLIPTLKKYNILY